MIATWGSLSMRWWHAGRMDGTTRTGPPPRRPSGPILIHDAVTPFAGETLLLFGLRETYAKGETDGE